jgi:hypothetical protein
MTLGNMRALGVQRLIASCLNHPCCLHDGCGLLTPASWPGSNIAAVGCPIYSITSSARAIRASAQGGYGLSASPQSIR